MFYIKQKPSNLRKIYHIMCDCATCFVVGFGVALSAKAPEG